MDGRQTLARCRGFENTLVQTMRDREVACCPCFETLASLAPQHEVVVFQQVRPHPERVRMFRARPQNFTAAGVFGRVGDRMAAIKRNSANCGSWVTAMPG